MNSERKIQEVCDKLLKNRGVDLNKGRNAKNLYTLTEFRADIADFSLTELETLKMNGSFTQDRNREFGEILAVVVDTLSIRKERIESIERAKNAKVISIISILIAGASLIVAIIKR